MLGVAHLGGNKEGGQVMDILAKERILSDIQFRGAISDFHPFKAKIVDSDYDMLLIRANDDDIYGDGNNFEVWTAEAPGSACIHHA